MWVNGLERDRVGERSVEIRCRNSLKRDDLSRDNVNGLERDCVGERSVETMRESDV